MEYPVTYTCGHTATLSLYGPSWEVDRKLRWLQENSMCSDCYKKNGSQKRAEELEKAKENARRRNLPELAGSEKQVAWAMTIRDRFFARLDAFIESNLKKGPKTGSGFFLGLRQQAMAYFSAQKQAKFWIDNRFDLTSRPLELSNQLNKLISSREESRDRAIITEFRRHRSIDERRDISRSPDGYADYWDNF